MFKKDAGEFGVEAAEYEFIAVVVFHSIADDVHALVIVGAAVGFSSKA